MWDHIKTKLISVSKTAALKHKSKIYLNIMCVRTTLFRNTYNTKCLELYYLHNRVNTPFKYILSISIAAHFLFEIYFVSRETICKKKNP